MSLAVIEKGVPFPGQRRDGSMLALMRGMEIGDSFVVPRTTAQLVRVYYQRLSPAKYVSRKVDEQSVRVWRVA